MLHGLLNPSFSHTETLLPAVINTLSFALLAVFISAICGLLLATIFHQWWVRMLCAAVRSVHELFWALLLLQVFGLTPLSGILAIALPYSGIFAKLYAEVIDEQNSNAAATSPATNSLVAFFYYRLPDALPQLKHYTRYRFECALRSSAILGFIGLPTLGFHLETALAQGLYADAFALIWIFIVLVAALRLWLRKALLPIYLALAWLSLPSSDQPLLNVSFSRLLHDATPAPLRNGFSLEQWPALQHWLNQLVVEQAFPALIDTLTLSLLALMLSGVLALIQFPLVSRYFVSKRWRWLGHGWLILLRTIPEYLLAYLFLQCFGLSMLPAILALGLHNGSIIAHLVGGQSKHLKLRPDHPTQKVALYSYEVVPRLYSNFLAFLLYRWEVIIRESAILGILGVATIGFYIDSAFAEIRLDRALLLILLSALLNIAVDAFSCRLRARLRHNATASATQQQERT